MKKLLLIAMLVLSSCPAFAVEPEEVMADPALEARARAISKDLRCLVCQNESIDDSHADLAKDLRLLVRERLTAGDSNAQVRAYIVARYGEFVLLKPPFNPGTALLWLGPLLGLMVGGVIVWRTLKASSQNAGQGELSPEERAQLAQRLSAPPSRRE